METYNICCGQRLSVEDSFNNAALQQTNRGRQISGRFSGQLHSSAAKKFYLAVCHLPKSDCSFHVEPRAQPRGGFGWSVETGSGRSLLGGHRGAAYVQNVKGFGAGKLIASKFFLFSFKE